MLVSARSCVKVAAARFKHANGAHCARSHATTATGSVITGPLNIPPNSAAVFEAIVTARVSALSFAPAPVPHDVVRRVLAATQRSPSSFNAQPYRIILVRTPDVIARLSNCMLAGNRARVAGAPLSAVFIADNAPLQGVDDLRKLEAGAGASPAHLRHLSEDMAVYVGGGAPDAVRGALDAATTALGGVTGLTLPSLSSATTWSASNTALALETFLLAATSHGLATSAMVGFDGGAVGRLLGLPSRWTTSVVVSVGYPHVGGPARRRSPRFPMETICREGHFEVPMKE